MIKRTVSLLIAALFAFQISNALYCNRVFQGLVTGETDHLNGSYVHKFEAPSRSVSKPFRIFKNEDGILSVTKNLDLDTGGTQRRNVSNSDRSTPRAIHCLYKFIAKEDERVALSFSSFRLRSNEPECTQEYVDIYVNFKPDDDLNTAIGQEQPNGRFCTTVLPRRVVSLHNMIVLSIYSLLGLPLNDKPLFSGHYEFFKPKISDQIGPAADGTLCNHTIYSSVKREGEFHSVTYPGSYVKDLLCSYKFIGEPNQRVRLEFLDLDLYSGGTHCPFDSVKVFDGLDEINDPLIQTICGSHRSLVIYSTHENLLITFSTLKRETEIQNRGFSAYFEFSDKFFDPSFIQGPHARHIRGSECDQRIISNKDSTGLVISPQTRNHPNAICRYIFEGLQNSLDYEKVLIRFLEFDLKTQRILAQELQQSTTTTSTTTTTTTTTTSPALLLLEPLSVNSSTLAQTTNATQTNTGATPLNTTSGTSSDQSCPDNYVRLYTGEQKADQKQDPNDYDYVFCGNEIPPPIESDAASLLLEYNSGTVGGQFKAEYKFIVDYRIPGQQLASSCNFIYRSDTAKSGTFNSPRHPSWYINDMNCSYTFLTKSDEVILVQFTSFKMENAFAEKIVGRNEACKGEDLVEIHELVLDSSERVILNQTEIGTYCGVSTPGPIVSYKPVRVTLRTNHDKTHYGFSAVYNFHQISELRSNEFVANCGESISARQMSQRSGSISSPPTYRSETYEKRNHICTWNITARPAHKIQLEFESFAIEGNLTARGCATAVVRLESNFNKRPIELCGILNSKNDVRKFVSDGDWMSVTFISTKRASGSDGFSATWTEVKKGSK